jgi:hypothetical protein
VRSDVDGTLALIDNALGGDYEVSGDAMRCAPPRVAVTFTWDEDAEIGSVMFTGVDMEAVLGIRPGSVVRVDGRRCVVTWVTEDETRGFMIDLTPDGE